MFASVYRLSPKGTAGDQGRRGGEGYAALLMNLTSIALPEACSSRGRSDLLDLDLDIDAGGQVEALQ